MLLCCEVLRVGHIWRYCLWECCVFVFWFVLCLCFCSCALNQVSRSGVIYGAASCLWQCWLRPSTSFFKPSLTSGVGLMKWKRDNTAHNRLVQTLPHIQMKEIHCHHIKPTCFSKFFSVCCWRSSKAKTQTHNHVFKTLLYVKVTNQATSSLVQKPFSIIQTLLSLKI